MADYRTSTELEGFHGAKLALVVDGKVLVYRRDDFDHIPYPGCWDFPGGGREGEESPEECVLRELNEEFALSMSSSRLEYKLKVPSLNGKGSSFFFVAKGLKSEIDSIVFGDEGQCWQLMGIQEFLNHPKAIPALVSRFRLYLDAAIG
ncbi:MAG: NUDIX hydrolase [Pseudomonadota bacterium]